VPPLRYKKLSYVALDVTDRARSVAFQQATIGLELNPDVAPGFEGALLRSRDAWCDIALYPASAPGLRRVSFEVESVDDLEAAQRHLASLGIQAREVPASDLSAFAQQRAFRFAEPRTGLVVELSVGQHRTPPPFAGSGAPSNITQIGHAVIYVTDAPAVTKFFLDELNFRASDFVGDAAFLRCFPNPFHHSLAVTPGPENRLNHVNFLVSHLDDVGRALYRLKAQDVPIVFGPGRHPPSGSVFLYFTDPDGFTFEFSTGMEEFPEVAPRPPRNLPRTPDSLDFWGSTRTERYGQVGRFVTSGHPEPVEGHPP
jgi:2,3-dihydroxy-p-cumate/2,3-dihydroxybenzoate 3,4-dioxygenase